MNIVGRGRVSGANSCYFAGAARPVTDQPFAAYVFSPDRTFRQNENLTYPHEFTDKVQRLIPRKVSCCSAIALPESISCVILVLLARTFGKVSGCRTLRNRNCAKRDISTDLHGEGLRVRAGERGTFSEVK